MRARSRQRPLFLNCNSCARTSNARRLHALPASRVVAPGPGAAGLARLAAVARARADGVRWPPGGLFGRCSVRGRAARRVEPSWKEKWTLSDPGRFGSEAHRRALFAGREPYDPDRGRSGYFRPVSGSAPRALVFRGMYLLAWDLYLVVPEGLELRYSAGFDLRGVPVPGLAPGVVYDPGIAVTEDPVVLSSPLAVSRSGRTVCAMAS